jgi:uncharacterized membrane protein
MEWIALTPLLLIIGGFALRLNPLLVVLIAGMGCAWVAGWSALEALQRVGTVFTEQRYLLSILLVLPLVAILEQRGLRARAADWIRRRRLSAGRLLQLYLGLRQSTAAAGLTSLGGHPQSVRPLLAPMVLALRPNASLAEQQQLKAMCAATDNIGLFFGEDIFLAFSGVLLMQGTLAGLGYPLDPLSIALWGIPTALCAFAIHGLRLQRLHRFDR